MNAEKIVNAYLSGSIDVEGMEKQITQLVRQRCKEQRELCAEAVDTAEMWREEREPLKQEIRNAPTPFEDQ